MDLNENLEGNQIFYQQNYDKLLKNENQSNLRKILLCFGITIIVIEFIYHFFLLILKTLGIGYKGNCDEEDPIIREECLEESSKEHEKLDNAVRLVLPCLILTCIILCFLLSNNKKIIIINCICIIIKLFLYIGYLIKLSKFWDDGKLSFFMVFISLEVVSDICLIIYELKKKKN